MFCRRCVSPRGACVTFFENMFSSHAAREHCTQYYVYITHDHVCALHQTHPLARSNWFNTLHLALNIVRVAAMRVVCLCCAVWVSEIHPKKNCLRDTKNDHFYHLPVPTSKMWNSGFSCTPTSALDGTHFALSRIRRSCIFPSDRHRADFYVTRSCVHNSACASTVMCMWLLVLYRLCVRCYHNRLLCVHITWKCECFKILKMSLFSILPVPTRKMWNSTISCTPTSTFVVVQIFISGDRRVHNDVSWLHGGCRVHTITKKCVFRRECFPFSR